MVVLFLVSAVITGLIAAKQLSTSTAAAVSSRSVLLPLPPCVHPRLGLMPNCLCGNPPQKPFVKGGAVFEHHWAFDCWKRPLVSK
jgi:hypothetical protein